MESLLATYYTAIAIFIASIVVLFSAFVRHRYGYWKRKNVPFLQPKFPLGNLMSFLPKGVSYGLISDDFYHKFKAMGSKLGG